MRFPSLVYQVRNVSSGANRCPDRAARRLEWAAGPLDSSVVSRLAAEAYDFGAGCGCWPGWLANTPGLTRRCTSVSRTPNVAS